MLNELVLSAAPLMGWSVMSMRPGREHKIPVMTAAVARAAFPRGCLVMRIRDALGVLFADEAFADLFAVRGRPAVSPARLALVSVLQYAENLSDRQAADAVRGRLDWKYALGLELTDEGFDASVLSEFRARPACDEAAGRVLELLLGRLGEEGLLAAGGCQRTDATCVLAAIGNLNRLELVTETMRAALEVVTVCAPGWPAALAPPSWYERYAQRAGDYRLPRTHASRDAHAMTIGQDGYLLLEAIYRAGTPFWLRQVPAVQVLRRVWVQRYYRQEETVRWRGKGELPPSSVLIVSPYDTDARYSVKRAVGWEGYKAHFTETCDADRPNLIVHAVTTAATTTDVETTPVVHTEPAHRGLLPTEHYVDAGYVSVDQIIEARDRYGIDLIGPLPPDSG